MRNHMLLAAVAGLAALITPNHAFAQPAPIRPAGFMLGVHTVGVPGIAIAGGEGQNGAFNTTFGAGAGVTAGWIFNQTLGIYTTLDVVKQNTAPTDTPEGSWGLAHLEVGARANLPVGGTTVPYVTAGIGARSLAARATFDDGDAADVSISGGYASLGAGLERPISRSMSIDGGIAMGFGRFSHFKVGGDQSTESVNPTHSIRVRLGVTWHPAVRRTT